MLPGANPSTGLLYNFAQADGPVSGWSGALVVEGGRLASGDVDGNYVTGTSAHALATDFEMWFTLAVRPGAGYGGTIAVRRPADVADPNQTGLLISFQNDGDFASSWWASDRVNYADTIVGAFEGGHQPIADGDKVGIRLVGQSLEVYVLPVGETVPTLRLARDVETEPVSTTFSVITNSGSMRIDDLYAGSPLTPDAIPEREGGAEFDATTFDDFEVDGDVDPLRWIVTQGELHVNHANPDGRVYGSGGWCTALSRLPTDPDCEVYVDHGYTSDMQVWVRRSGDARTGYWAYVRNTPTQGWLQFGKQVNGAYTTFAELEFENPADDYRFPASFGLRARGSSIQLWQRLGEPGGTETADWQLMFEVNDESIPDGGRASFEFWGGATFDGVLSASVDNVVPVTVDPIDDGDEGGLPPSPRWPGDMDIPEPPAWVFVLCDEDGNEQTEVDQAVGRSLAFIRNHAAEVTFGLDLRSPAAYSLMRILRNGLPRLKCYRENTLRFNGWWSPQRDTAGGDDAGTFALTFRSPIARYETIFTDLGAAAYSVRNRDAGLIATDLLALASLGLIPGVIESTVDRDRFYESKQVLEAIIQLTEVQGGFDFTEAFVEGDATTLAEFNVHAALGFDRSETVLFEHGEGTLENVLSVSRELRYPVNYVRVLGEQGLYADATDSASIAKYGQITKMITAAAGTIDVATLQARADSELRPELERVVEFVPDPILAPSPWDDYWLGDTVTTRAREGALIVDEAVRVNGIRIDLDDEGNESGHALTFEQEGDFLPDETGFPEGV